MLAMPAGAALSEEYPELQHASIEIEAEELSQLEARLKAAQRTEENTFELIDATAPGQEHRSTDYTASSLNVWNGVATVNAADAEILENFLTEQGLQNASDAEKIAGTLVWIHNNLIYDAYHTGSYTKSCFVEKGGQCNVYNGAMAAMLLHLGYRVQLMRGYRGSTGSETAHWWVELLTDGEPLVFETGNREDGVWYYLGRTYAETHGGDRDYIKCDQYAFSGEEYEYFGAAAYVFDARWEEETDVTLTGRVWKGSGYEVSQVGLLLGPSADALTELAFDSVEENFNAINDARGFSMSYRLSDYGVSLAPGETRWAAFYVDVDGVRCQSAPFAVTTPAVSEPPAETQAVPETEIADETWSLPIWLIPALLTLVGGAVLAGGVSLAGRAAKKREAKTVAEHISHL